MAARVRATEQRHETGTAVVGTLVGFCIFMLRLLLAVQTLVHLYATSTLTSAAFDAAHRVASSPDAVAAIPSAQADAQRSLGSFGPAHTRFVWERVDGGVVVLRVLAQSPGFLPLPRSFRQIDRTVTVRTERFR
ncbi:MAG: hypothetical protein ACRDXE_10100 [Acidimicrobiales bacterium]